MDKLKNTRILGLVGIVGLFLGIVMPYLTFSFLGYTQSISLWGYWEGKVMMVLTIANGLFIFKDYVQKYVPKLFETPLGQKIENANPKMALIPTILVVVFAIYLYTTLDVDTNYLKYGLGFWTLWIGVVALVAHSILYKGNDVQINQPVQPQMSEPVQQPQAQSQSVEQPVVQPVQQSVDQPVETPMSQVVQQSQVQPQSVQQPVEPQNASETNSQPAPNVKFCPNCGTQIDANANSCFMCGK